MKEMNNELSVIEVGKLYSKRIPKQKKGKLPYMSRIEPIKHKTGVPKERFEELEHELISKAR